MKSDDLRIFRAVASAASIGGAARLLNTTQSNVTARVQKLEDMLGLPLFRRHARGVELTPAGERLLPYADEVETLLQDARRRVMDDGRASGTLRIGAMEATTASRLSSMLAEYMDRFPDVDLSLTTGTTTELVEAVVSRKLDLAFVCGPIIHPRVRALPFLTEEMALLMPSGIQALEDIGGNRLRAFVLRKGCAYRRKLEDALSRRGMVDFHIVEYGTIDAIMASVSAGLGIALMPVSVCASYAPRYRWSVAVLREDERFLETVIVQPKQSTVTSALREFLALLDQHRTAPPSGQVVHLKRSGPVPSC